jgi:formylglycine-generating enzyme required for sulfatase activity
LPNKKGRWRKNPNIVRIWPWGNEQPDDSLLNFRRKVEHSTSVGKFPQGASPYQVFDMAGNVWEWCRSKWASSYVTEEDDDPETDAPRVVRGGSWISEESYVRCAVRFKKYPHKPSDQIGFRIVLIIRV